MSKEPKFYVIWEGKEQWIFTSRDECKDFVVWVKWAKYKSFSSLSQAEEALGNGFEQYYKKEKRYEKEIPFEKNSIAVDAACSHNPGLTEYQWIDLVTGEKVFHQKLWEATNNIGEFLALVHWLSYLKNKNSDKALYSDSKHAMNWILQWKCKTNFKKTEANKEIFNVIKRAEDWLKNNDFITNILKRDTKNWWEIPADFGRK